MEFDPSNVDDPNYEGETKLMVACRHSHDLSDLIKAGANVNAATNNGFTALMLAAETGQEQCAHAMIVAKANLEAQNNEGMTALLWACTNGHDRVARALLEAGADVNKDGPQGYSYLMVACQNGHLEVRLRTVTQCQRFA